MQRKPYNILTFSDVPIPSFKHPYRGVMFVEKAPEGFLSTAITISPLADEEFTNKSVKVLPIFFKAGNFKQNQYNLLFRISNLFKLTIKLFFFRFLGVKVDFIRTGSTYLSFLVWLTQPRKVTYIADICDFYYELYEEFNMPFSRFMKPIIYRLEAFAQRRADLVFVDTAAQRDLLVSGLGVRKDRCTVLPNGINTEKFPYLKEKPTDLLEQYGFGSQDKILFYAGDVSEMDGIDLILRFMEEKKATSYKALIIGKGNTDFLQKIKGQINSKGLQSKVILDGFKPYDEYHRYLGLADVCVAPFRITNTSNTVECAKIITYLLMGKPVLATKADGIYSLYKDSISYFSDGNYNEFSEMLNNLLHNPPGEETRNQLRALGKRFDFSSLLEYEYKVIEDFMSDPAQDFSKRDYI